MFQIPKQYNKATGLSALFYVSQALIGPFTARKRLEPVSNNVSVLQR